jgi:hypothetical protein
MRVDKPFARTNSEVEQVSRSRHQHHVPHVDRRRSDPPERFVEGSLDFASIASAQSIIVPDGHRIEIECSDNDPHAIEPVSAPPLRPESRADERASTLGIINRHVVQAPG